MFVDITAKDDAMKAQLNGVKSQLGVIGVAIGTMAGNLVTTAISSATRAMTGFISRGISGAISLEETISKVGVTFGDSTEIIMKQADDMAAKFGTVKGPILEAAANFGQITKGAGFAQKASAELSAKLLKLAADASSFHNVPMDIALEKIRSGLAGEAEPLRTFGVLLSEEAVALESVRLGLSRTGKDLDEVTKMTARTSVITKGLIDVQGDLERTADSTSNTWKRVTGSVQNLAVEMGETLSPVVTKVLSDMNTGLSALKLMWDDNKAATKDMVKDTVDGMKVESESIGWVQKSIGGVADAWRNVTVAFMSVQATSTGWVEWMVKNLPGFGQGINRIQQALGGAKVSEQDFMKAWIGDLEKLKTKQFEVLGELTKKPLPSDEMNKYFEKAKEKAKELKAEIVKATDVSQSAKALNAMVISAHGALGKASGTSKAARRAAIRQRQRRPKTAALQEAAARAAKAKLGVVPPKKKPGVFKSETMDFSGFESKLRESIASVGGDVQTRQLTVQEQIRDEQIKAREAFDKWMSGGISARLA